MSDRRVAVVTGGGSGIGLASATALAHAGLDVLIAGRREAVLDEARAAIAAAAPDGTRVVALPADVGRPEDCARLMRHAVDTLGGVDVLVSCAGFYEPVPVADVTADDWDRSQAGMLRGPALLSAAAVRHMRDNGGGRIVLITSNYAQTPELGSASYAAAKAGLNSLARSIVCEHAKDGIVANAVAPGWVRTPITEDFFAPLTRANYERVNPAARYAEPEEIGNLVAYLATDAPAFLAGDTIVIDGGETIRAAQHE
jgi:NAD(P)-dependent dehydrogenase (short-subunit alcohol dehydrogenase family)